MEERFTYIVVDLLTILFPFIFSWTKQFDFQKEWRYFLPVNLFVSLIYILWDILFTYWKVWGFNERYTMGYYLGLLPIEEVLFFFCIPFACLFTYYCFRKYVFARLKTGSNSVWLILSILFFALAFLNCSRLYTDSAFLSCGISFFLAYMFKKLDLIHFLVFYSVILIPFFLVNGVLTGSFFQRVVVFYNNQENLGVRLATIPVEDLFYGMALLLFNILGYEYLRDRTIKS